MAIHATPAPLTTTSRTPMPEAVGPGEVSRSAVVAMRGYHAFRIDGYSTTTSARSTPFRAGGRDWHVEYRAGWSRRDNNDFVFVYLHYYRLLFSVRSKHTVCT
uniref:MATH domain-containing protein n=1 Tax=Oryza punctata TaxID=4537 RepID=A0A0E0M8Z3_ORYPU